ncbi:uncharacterized mitochondrial protein AtMg00810-like [Arachis stenosperma]|uniref:uncharacterized mitochondrial protein AtMg00810-like n=1 Tax=Arachis stenosperma TaxID=217475 RepID=UPI0025AC06E4|nr:uncharacterized mitochondrial protein AtMg00810-like [Arachis stenosperma]
MTSEFDMSMMGELTFFLGLQIKQSSEGIFIHQEKFAKEFVKKFGLECAKPMETPMHPNIKLDKDEHARDVDETRYRGMIGSLMYLTSSRPDIIQSVDFAGDRIDRRSTSGMCCFLGKSLNVCSRKKQATVALSTTEAEYIAATSCCSQLL